MNFILDIIYFDITFFFHLEKHKNTVLHIVQYNALSLALKNISNISKYEHCKIFTIFFLEKK